MEVGEIVDVTSLQIEGRVFFGKRGLNFIEDFLGSQRDWGGNPLHRDKPTFIAPICTCCTKFTRLCGRYGSALYDT